MGLSLSSKRFQALLEQFVREAVSEFQRRIRSAGLELTGELLDSFKIKSLQAGNTYISQMVETAGYFRIKDLRSMHYARMPPLAAMEYFVEKTGIDRFYVPGYGDRTPSSETIAIERVAWAIRKARMQKPDVKRGYRGIYNEVVKGKMGALRSEVSQAGARLAIQELREILAD
ncbi:hypothetical protein BWI97_07160 [Siphonobacter sp. BAB-5405]|uniref:hypothetical protein n=1 Tax=Siphonobacter sp. BAB-5405 TaxID=1864825 RepID=UPI000C807848|nr:hypothetical protein [Siphonobacter sp. BAB-5405]PMD97401.1 hypothetical protein BWI97_07160 [Siphonobacter sp. BAB-5405]